MATPRPKKTTFTNITLCCVLQVNDSYAQFKKALEKQLVFFCTNKNIKT